MYLQYATMTTCTITIVNLSYYRDYYNNVIYFIAGYYAAECTCKNEVNCDGARYIVGNSRRCTALKRGNAPGRAVVGSKSKLYHLKISISCVRHNAIDNILV